MCVYVYSLQWSGVYTGCIPALHFSDPKIGFSYPDPDQD